LDCIKFFNQINGKKIAMCGIGVSNTPLILEFLSKGAKVYACDRRTRELIGAVADELEAAGAELRLGDGYLDNLEVDIIFRTPGMNFNLPPYRKGRQCGRGHKNPEAHSACINHSGVFFNGLNNSVYKSYHSQNLFS